MVSVMTFRVCGLSALLLATLALSSTSGLTTRQDIIPASCERTCSPVNGIIFSPQDCDVIPEFCCPRTNMLQFVGCFQCFDDDMFAKTGQHADNAQRQKVIDDLISICDVHGFVIDVSKGQITLHGQDVNRSGIDIVPDNDPRSSSASSSAPTSRASPPRPSSSSSTSEPPATSTPPSQSSPSSTPGPVDTGLPSNNTGGARSSSGSDSTTVLAAIALLHLLSGVALV